MAAPARSSHAARCLSSSAKSLTITTDIFAPAAVASPDGRGSLDISLACDSGAPMTDLLVTVSLAWSVLAALRVKPIFIFLQFIWRLWVVTGRSYVALTYFLLSPLCAPLDSLIL